MHIEPHILERQLVGRLKLRHLSLLVEVDKQGSIVKAADALNITQPGATKMIRDLEANLGLQLFKRSNRGAETTTYGSILVKHARLILNEIKHTSEDLLSLYGGMSGEVSVGILLAAAPLLLPRAAVLLRTERPNVSLSISEGVNDRLMPELRAGELDMVVGRLPRFRERDGLEQTILFYEPISVVVREGHPVSSKEAISLEDLEDQQWILPPKSTSLRREIESAFYDLGHHPPQYSVESLSTLFNHRYLLQTDAVGVMPYHVASTCEGLVRLPVEMTTTATAVGVTIRADGPLGPAPEYLMTIFERVAAELAAVDQHISLERPANS